VSVSQSAQTHKSRAAMSPGNNHNSPLKRQLSNPFGSVSLTKMTSLNSSLQRSQQDSLQPITATFLTIAQSLFYLFTFTLP